MREVYPSFSSQLMIRAIDVASSTYKVKRGKYPNNFKSNSSVVYDDRVITFRDSGSVNIWTSNGRMDIPIHIYDLQKFKHRKGQIDLVIKNNKFYLICTIDVDAKEQYDPKGMIGVDLGVKNIAASSEGDIFSSNEIERKRKQYQEHRQRLQKADTRSARNRIKEIGNKESRFRKDTNHCIAKKIIEKAKALQFGVAIEELTNINKKVTVKRQLRNQRMSWSFAQLRAFLTYKAERDGVPLIVVNPAYTSRTCNECKHCDKNNRKNQNSFLCVSCGHAENADFNASKNIRDLGLQSMSLLSPPERAAVTSPCL